MTFDSSSHGGCDTDTFHTWMVGASTKHAGLGVWTRACEALEAGE